MTRITVPSAVVSDDSTETTVKTSGRGRKPGSVSGARPGRVIMAAILNGSLIAEEYTHQEMVGMSSELAKDIKNDAIILAAQADFKNKHGISPEYTSCAFLPRTGIGGNTSTGTGRVCPVDADTCTFIKPADGGTFKAIYHEWEVSCRKVEEFEDWIYVSRSIKPVADNKRTPKVGHFVHISEITAC